MTSAAAGPGRILVVDDHPLYREALVAALVAPGVWLSCESAAGLREAQRRIFGSAPYAVVLSDFKLPDGDGLELLGQVRAHSPGTACVLLSGSDTAQLGARARRMGLRGYLSKALEPHQIVAAVRTVLAGGSCFRDLDDGDSGPALTERQIEVLEHVGQGLSSKEIARELGVSASTVKDHLTLIFVRLGVGTRAEAVARAAALGLIRFDRG
ncbi:response regulator transcription factor [Piscinibacter sakaiensis]|uniref:Two-component system, regulatory protein n=1 Tax=Piscinibacter sakaiensis TaxID=1547922 RepID=A0A0K8NY74_PISS1|nr:response regulator transcription factor [Piscinibacter sakaiensis]GAP35357.1 two-component system, regulatory protein [Piscinibacter sakaiensis]